MIGALIGDIVGSVYEWNNIKTKEFKLFSKRSFATDDSVMTLALGQAMLDSNGDVEALKAAAVKRMREIGRMYPYAGYGGHFNGWLWAENPEPYNSCGNGAAMRVSIAGFAAKTLDEAKAYAAAVTECTHNHPDGMKGAEAIAVMIFMARDGATKEEMRKVFTEQYYPIDFTLDSIRPVYKWGGLCSDTVPQAMESFFESESFEDCIRNAISIGGDSDTLAAIAGPVAEAFYGVPVYIAVRALRRLDNYLLDIWFDVSRKYPDVLIRSNAVV